MKHLLPSLLLIATVLAIGPVDAQTTAPGATVDRPRSLNGLKLDFDIERVEQMKPLAALDGLYREQLEKLRLDAQSRGSLEQVIAVQAELAALEGRATDETGEDFPDLAKARSIYEKAKGEREAALRQGLLVLISAQKTKLEAMRTAQTQASQLEEAVRTDEALRTLLDLEQQALRGSTFSAPETRASAPVASGPRARSLKVRVQIDGMSHLHIAGDGIWFDHTRGNAAPPGRHQGDFPTYLNDRIEWRPEWEGKVTQRYPIALDLSSIGTRSEIHLRQSNGRGFAKVIQQPDPSNGHTAIVEMRDETPEGRLFNGSDWMEFRLSW